MSSREPIATAELFPELDVHLLALLRSLSPQEWQRPTVCSQWCVKDIACHLLDGNLRRLSLQRDGHTPSRAPRAFATEAELVSYLNQLNADWTAATDRLSPRVIIRLLEVTGPELAALFQGLDPYAPAIFPVAWAGESESANWFDIAREYTEKWHHQQQMWDAVGKPSPILNRRLYHPVLETFMRALPQAFRNAGAPEGVAVSVHVTGDAGGTWSILRQKQAWRLTPDRIPDPAAMVTFSPEAAWRVLTKRKDVATALKWFPSIEIRGDVNLAARVIEMVCIMA